MNIVSNPTGVASPLPPQVQVIERVNITRREVLTRACEELHELTGVHLDERTARLFLALVESQR